MSLTLLKNEILPAAFNKDGSTVVDCVLRHQSGSQDQFQSNVLFLTVKVKSKQNIEQIPVVVKFEPSSYIIRSELKTDLQFYNEVLMYSSVFPLLDEHNRCEDFFPKFYYGLSTIEFPEKDVLLIEDFSPKGFKMADERCYLDYEHLSLVMRKLGKFHALSYSAKKDSGDKLYSCVSKLRETRWIKGVSRAIYGTKACFHRALDPLIEGGHHVDKLTSILSRLDDDILKFFEEFLAPEEPRAVVCHGDFCRNNMVFQYDQGVPLDVRFFDVAMARYTSPAVDISLLMLMNASREMRLRHWDDLLGVYHDALVTSVTATSYAPSLEVVQEEVRKKALYGLIHCCYFLPLMLYENDVDLAMLMDAPPEHVGERFTAVGGDVGTRLLMDMVEELLDRGCLNA